MHGLCRTSARRGWACVSLLAVVDDTLWVQKAVCVDRQLVVYGGRALRVSYFSGGRRCWSLAWLPAGSNTWGQRLKGRLKRKTAVSSCMSGCVS